MALTLDGMIPSLGGNSGSSAALGAGGGILGGGIAGLLGGALAGGLLGNRGGYGNGYGAPYAAPAATAVATDIVLNPAFQSLQTQIQTTQAQIGHNALASEIRNDVISLAGGQADIGGEIAAVATALAAGNFTTLNSINGLGRDVTAQANQNVLEQLNSFNALNTTTLQGFNQANITALQGFNQAAFNQNIATQQIIAQGVAMAAQAAECCCSIKALITADGNTTRALINANTMQDLRDKNVELAGQVSNFR